MYTVSPRRIIPLSSSWEGLSRGQMKSENERLLNHDVFIALEAVVTVIVDFTKWR